MSHRTQRILVYVLVGVAVVVLWWLISATGSVKRLVLPTPTDVWHALRHLLDQPSTVSSAVWETLRLLLIAFAISAPCGLLLGVVVGRSRLLTAAYEPLLANLNTIPVIVLYPLLAGLLGLGGLPQVVLGAIVCFFPVAISSMWAARDVDATLLLAARAMGARGPRLIRAVSLPAAMPGIFTGLRTGLGLAFVTIIAAEFISSTAGLGYELAQMSQSFRTPELFAWLLITLVVSALINAGWSTGQNVIERRVQR